MQSVVSNVYSIDGLRTANVFVITDDAGLTLIDTGMPGEADKIITQLEAAGYGVADIQRILVTHTHSDHVGSLADLVQRSGAQVMAHQAEVAYIEQTQSLVYTAFWRRFVGWLVDRLSKSAPCAVDVALQDGDVVDVLGGLRVIHTPGHTPGSIVLYQSAQQVLFCGDVIFNGGPFGGGGGITLPPTFFSVDAVQAAASVSRIAELPVETMCFGHGAPIVSRAGEQLRAVLG